MHPRDRRAGIRCSLPVGESRPTSVLDVLGGRPMLGASSRAEDERGGRAVASCSRPWRSGREHFGGADPAILGDVRSSLDPGRLRSTDRRRAAAGPARCPWRSSRTRGSRRRCRSWLDRAAQRHQRGAHYLTGIGAAAHAARRSPRRRREMDAMAGRSRRAAIPTSTTRANFGVFSCRSATARARRRARPGSAVLLRRGGARAAASACANVANLLLARGESRRRELSVRSGARRSRAARASPRQLLVESLVLATLGTGGGACCSRSRLVGSDHDAARRTAAPARLPQASLRRRARSWCSPAWRRITRDRGRVRACCRPCTLSRRVAARRRR